MKKVFSNHWEVCHIYASQSQKYGRAGNIHFKDNIIYSYRWYIMSVIRGKNAFIRNYAYSRSTGTHLSLLRSALSGNYNIVECSEPELTGTRAKDNFANFADFLDLAKELQGKFERSKLQADFYEREYNSLHNDVCNYLNAVNCRHYKRFMDEFLSYSPRALGSYKKIIDRNDYNLRIKELKNRLQIIREHREKKRLAKLMNSAKYLEEIENFKQRWREGEASHYYFSHTFCIDGVEFYVSLHNLPVLLRLKGNEIQTSKGACVSLESAHKLYERIKNRKTIKGEPIGHYTVRGLEPDDLIVGCHRIPLNEINLLAESLGW